MSAKPTPPRAPAPDSPQTVGFLLVPGFALMSYAAAIEPLRAANLLSGRELYRWWHAAPGGRPVTASNGVARPRCWRATGRALAAIVSAAVTRDSLNFNLAVLVRVYSQRAIKASQR